MDTKLVSIYHRGRMIKTHVRQPRGGRATNPEDYPAELTACTTRTPDRIQRSAAHSRRTLRPSRAPSSPIPPDTAVTQHQEIAMTRTVQLTHLLKRLQVGPMASTLPERIALTRREQLDQLAQGRFVDLGINVLAVGQNLVELSHVVLLHASLTAGAGTASRHAGIGATPPAAQTARPGIPAQGSRGMGRIFAKPARMLDSAQHRLICST